MSLLNIKKVSMSKPHKYKVVSPSHHKMRVWLKGKQAELEGIEFDGLGNPCAVKIKNQWYGNAFILEHCIGHKDQGGNGQFIFEGDIMQVADDMPNILIEPIGEKGHDSEDLTVGFSWQGNGETIPIDTGILKGKVIGNIHQNSELLEIKS